MHVGSKIRTLRKDAELSQEELARRANITLKSLGEIERGDVENPHLQSLVKIAAGLGVSVGELLSEEAEGVPKAPAPSSTGLGLLSEEERLVYDQAFGGLRWAMDYGLQENLISEDTIEDPEIKEDLDRLAQKMAIREIGRR